MKPYVILFPSGSGYVVLDHHDREDDARRFLLDTHKRGNHAAALYQRDVIAVEPTSTIDINPVPESEEEYSAYTYREMHDKFMLAAVTGIATRGGELTIAYSAKIIADECMRLRAKVTK